MYIFNIHELLNGHKRGCRYKLVTSPPQSVRLFLHVCRSCTTDHYIVGERSNSNLVQIYRHRSGGLLSGTHYAWINTPREEGGLKGLKIPLLSDLTKQIAKDYGVLLEDEGISLRLIQPDPLGGGDGFTPPPPPSPFCRQQTPWGSMPPRPR